jgi:hypothetical protein
MVRADVHAVSTEASFGGGAFAKQALNELPSFLSFVISS